MLGFVPITHVPAEISPSRWNILHVLSENHCKYGAISYYIGNKIAEIAGLAAENAPISLDTLDSKILAALQEDGRLSNVELAERVGLSPSPCLRRVKRLEEEGYIAGYKAKVDRRRLGLGMTVFVGVKFDTHRDVNARAFQEAVQTFPEVVACHMVSGEADFLLEVVVADLAAYDAFLSRTLLKLPMVRDIRSNFAIRTVKSEGALPVSQG
jgi:Lrp/AsnC family transcriptional regulator, leucine-responsive regulatory protein